MGVLPRESNNTLISSCKSEALVIPYHFQKVFHHQLKFLLVYGSVELFQFDYVIGESW